MCVLHEASQCELDAMRSAVFWKERSEHYESERQADLARLLDAEQRCFDSQQRHHKAEVELECLVKQCNDEMNEYVCRVVSPLCPLASTSCLDDVLHNYKWCIHLVDYSSCLSLANT